jgi:hypothetical protein
MQIFLFLTFRFIKRVLKGIIIIIIIIIITILWNKQLQTDRVIPINTPDIVSRDNEKGTCILIDVPILREKCD